MELKTLNIYESICTAIIDTFTIKIDLINFTLLNQCWQQLKAVNPILTSLVTPEKVIPNKTENEIIDLTK